jgi:hypothetical protein
MATPDRLLRGKSLAGTGDSAAAASARSMNGVWGYSALAIVVNWASGLP